LSRRALLATIGLAAAMLAALPAAFAEPAAAAPSTAPATASPQGAAQAPAPAGAKKAAEQKPVDLKEALARLAAASGPADYAAALDSFSTSLPPTDALALLDQSIPGAGQEYRKSLLVKAGDLDLLLSLFGDASARYEAAAAAPSGLPATPAEARPAKDASLLVRAARCSIAAGEADKASALAADAMLSAGSADLRAAARLVDAWVLLMQDRPEDASAIAQALAGAAKGSRDYPGTERRREARFIVWLCAPSEGKAEAKTAAAAKLASEFPGSPEALIAAGSASAPPLPHWYLGGLGTARAKFPRPASQAAGQAAQQSVPASSAASVPESPSGPASGASSAPAAPAAPAAQAPAAVPAASAAASSAPSPASKGKRLQVGYFSREDNAQALKSELSSKGFNAAIEIRFRAAAGGAAAPGAASPGKAEEKRWIVVVEGGKDPALTRQALKDAGYESYIVD